MPPESPHAAPGTSPFLLPALCSLSTCGLLGCDFLCLSVFLSKPLGDSEPIFLVLQCTISVSVRFLFVTFLAQLRTRLGTGGCSIDIHEMRASLPHALQRDTGPAERKGGRGKAVSGASDTGVFKAQPLRAHLCPCIELAAFLPVVHPFHVPSTRLSGACAVSGVNEWPCASYDPA